MNDAQGSLWRNVEDRNAMTRVLGTKRNFEEASISDFVRTLVLRDYGEWLLWMVLNWVAAVGYGTLSGGEGPRRATTSA